jgi:radical SAM family RiPP maturation amino acid epimerase
MKQAISRFPENPRFDGWRMRRIAAVRSELGLLDAELLKPTLAIELSDGCSVGCWFCAFAARRLRGVADYRSHQALFGRVVRDCIDLLGQAQRDASVLFFETEPHDNPDYLSFLRDYEQMTGQKLFTSTAVADDGPWLRQLLACYRDDTRRYLRINVLSTQMLDRIHEICSPEELRRARLVMQMKDSPHPKVLSGRILKPHEGLRALGPDEDPHQLTAPQGSICCLNGFVVNLVQRTIRLISPCHASKQWPKGYRVFDETGFVGETDFAAALAKLMDRNMFLTPPPAKVARWRDDLVLRMHAAGFDLTSPRQIHHFDATGSYRELGAMIASGTLSFERIQEQLCATPDGNPLLLAGALQDLYDKGLIDESAWRRAAANRRIAC